MSKDDQFWDKAFNDDSFGPTKPWKRLGADEPTALPILLDGDIVAYRAAAPCDGRGYAIINTDDPGKHLVTARYKKEIVKEFYEGKFDPAFQEIIPTKNPEPESYAIYNVDKIIHPILEKYPNAWLRTYLTGNTNFRQSICPDYKANRDGMERPVHLAACKQYLLNRYNAIMQDLLEADDLMGIEARRLLNQDRKFLIATIDKDLCCVPGGHYNFVKDEEWEVSEWEATVFFYAQCLMGDTTDNIPGIKGLGPKKSAKILAGAASETELFTRVLTKWAIAHPLVPSEDVVKIMIQSAELLWILQEEGNLYTPPIPEDEAVKLVEEQRNV